MRPTYETSDHLALETAVANRVGKAWGATPTKLPKFYKCDWALTRGDSVEAFIEVRCRNFTYEKYPTIIISSEKWAYLVNRDKTLHRPFFFCVRFADDKIYYVRPSHLADAKFVVKMGGRTAGGKNDRGDWQDIEPVVHIPTEAFKQVKEMGSIDTTPKA
jgi:hypothetical protein